VTDPRSKRAHPVPLVTDPRAGALDILHRVLAPRTRVFARELLDERLTRARLNEEDRRLMPDLVYGVIRRLGTLDAVIAAYADRPPHLIEPAVLDVLRLGLYQILFHERIPAHAAVNETVRLAAGPGKERTAGFVNAILRAVLREVSFAGSPDPARPRESFELTPGRTCVFGRPVLPPPADTARYIAASLSYPVWLVRRWLARYGSTRARETMAAGNAPPPIFVRPNRLKTDADDLARRLADAGIEAVPSPSGRTLRLPPHARPNLLACFREGLCHVQDDSSAAVCEFLDPKPGESVLDLCAAPGGKTCHCAELMDNRGRIVAVDVSTRRLTHVAENAKRAGATTIETVAADGADYAVAHRGQFDRVLLDAPCSNTGVLGRRVEARWRLGDKPLAELAGKQKTLLKAALLALRPGGILVYSVCSLEPEEGETLVAGALRAGSRRRLDAQRTLMPSPDGGDGMYMARIIREARDA